MSGLASFDGNHFPQSTVHFESIDVVLSPRSLADSILRTPAGKLPAVLGGHVSGWAPSQDNRTTLLPLHEEKVQAIVSEVLNARSVAQQLQQRLAQAEMTLDIRNTQLRSCEAELQARTTEVNALRRFEAEARALRLELQERSARSAEDIVSLQQRFALLLDESQHNAARNESLEESARLAWAQVEERDAAMTQQHAKIADLTASLEELRTRFDAGANALAHVCEIARSVALQARQLVVEQEACISSASQRPATVPLSPARVLGLWERHILALFVLSRLDPALGLDCPREDLAHVGQSAQRLQEMIEEEIVDRARLAARVATMETQSQLSSQEAEREAKEAKAALAKAEQKGREFRSSIEQASAANARLQAGLAAERDKVAALQKELNDGSSVRERLEFTLEGKGQELESTRAIAETCRNEAEQLRRHNAEMQLQIAMFSKPAPAREPAPIAMPEPARTEDRKQLGQDDLSLQLDAAYQRFVADTPENVQSLASESPQSTEGDDPLEPLTGRVDKLEELLAQLGSMGRDSF